MDRNRNQEYPLRQMQKDDLPKCQDLKAQTGWNQLLADWQRFWNLNPIGCFVVTDTDRIIGTVCTVAYENFGWVAMVIVDNEYRRQGIGTQLLMAGIEHLENRGLCVKLDATPEGKMLYDTLGFVDEYKAARYEWEGTLPQFPHPTICEPLNTASLGELNDFDQSIFGNSRQDVLKSYLDRYPKSSFCLRDETGLCGYIMAREGYKAFHIGPWVATSPTAALNLLQTCMLERQPERIFIDIIEPNPHALNMLSNLGFTLQRPFIRMFRGQNADPGKPELVYSMSGPELG
ncbi:GNAT family N-acetyltransferase [bacterium]|nr:GNAT family N-acetyltransferase [bacterium]